MEILFHVTPISRHNSTWWQFGPNPHKIPWQFHVIYPCFIYFPCWNMTWILGRVYVMEFPWHLLRKWWDFHRIWSHFWTRPNCRGKDMRKSLSQFLQGSLTNYLLSTNNKLHTIHNTQTLPLKNNHFQFRYKESVHVLYIIHTYLCLFPPHFLSDFIPFFCLRVRLGNIQT